MARHMDHSVLGGTLESSDNVPVELRENYYFALLLDNLNRSTNTETLKSIFGSLPGVLYTTVVDPEGQPMGIGEVVFTDEATMRDARKKMNGQIIDGTKICLREMVLFDVKPDYVKDHC